MTHYEVDQACRCTLCRGLFSPYSSSSCLVPVSPLQTIQELPWSGRAYFVCARVLPWTKDCYSTRTTQAIHSATHDRQAALPFTRKKEKRKKRKENMEENKSGIFCILNNFTR
jgi:hypothetical protein